MQMSHDKKVNPNVKSEEISKTIVMEASRWFVQTGMFRSLLKWPWLHLLSVPRSQLELISLSLIPNQLYRQDYRCIDLMTVSITASKPLSREEQIVAMEICAVFTIWLDFFRWQGRKAVVNYEAAMWAEPHWINPQGVWWGLELRSQTCIVWWEDTFW